MRKKFYLLVVLGLLLRLLLSIKIYSGDVNNHIAWGKDILRNGPKGVYSREFFAKYGTLAPTYPPIPLYLFTSTYSLYTWVYRTSWNLNNTYSVFPSNLIFFLEDQDTLPAFMKIPAIIADLILAAGIFLLTQKIVGDKNKHMPILASALVLFNPAFFYNSSYWGQIESIPLAFLLFSFYFLMFSNQYLLSALLFILAILTKQTSIIFIPVFIIIFFLKFGFKKSLYASLLSLFVFWISFLPFYAKGNILTFPFLTYWNKIQTGSGSSFVTDHAFNFWALVSGLGKIPDSQTWYIFSYHTWGYLFFLTILIIVLIRLLQKRGDMMVFYASFLIAASSFIFLTRMHERYLLQALPFLLLLGVKKRGYLWSFIFLSIFNFLNLYHNWWAPRMNWLVRIVSSGLFINSLIITMISLFFIYLLQYTSIIRRFSIHIPPHPKR